MYADNRLIIIRGPSGAGKSTVARKLFELATERTALIQQDYYRFIFNPAGGGSKPNSDTIHRMIEHNCTVSLEAGYDVILEGILSVKAYGSLLNRIIDAHKGTSYIFHFDVSFGETARRHETRQNTSDFSVNDMRNWYDVAHKSNHHLEQIIPECFSILETIEFIQKAVNIDNKLSSKRR
ncbi:AAA family ATPase [bacterium]|nr:AAA family ATPase [bacterium]